MKKLILLIFVCVAAVQVNAQKYPVYYSTGGELIFSGATVNYTEDWGDVSNDLRFTAFFHLKSYVHFNKSEKFGIFTGIDVRNVGINNRYVNMAGDLQQVLINRSDVTDLRMIQRVYTIGVPLALKFGNMDDRFYMYAGGAVELALQYKEKHFDGNEKLSGTKRTAWFSDKVNTFLPSVMVGGQFPGGVSLTFKYYLTDLINTSYSTNGVKIYEGVETKMFYVSLGVNLFHIKGDAAKEADKNARASIQ